MAQINKYLLFGELSENQFPYKVFVNDYGKIVISDADFEDNDYSSLIPISPEDWKEIVSFIEKEVYHR